MYDSTSRELLKVIKSKVLIWTHFKALYLWQFLKISEKFKKQQNLRLWTFCVVFSKYTNRNLLIRERQSMATFKPRPQPVRLLVLGSCWGESNGEKAYYIWWGKNCCGEANKGNAESDVLMKVADHFSKRAEFFVQEKVILNTYWRNQCNFIPLYKTFICPCNNSLM